MLFRVLNKTGAILGVLLDKLFSLIGYILGIAAGLGFWGIIFAFFVLSVLYNFVASSWPQILAVSIIGFSIYAFFKHMIRKFKANKKQYAVDEINKVISSVFGKYENLFDTVPHTDKIKSRSYKDPVVSKIPLEDQVSFYEERHKELNELIPVYRRLFDGHSWRSKKEAYLLRPIKPHLEKIQFPLDMMDLYTREANEFLYFVHDTMDFYEKNLKIVKSGVDGEDRMDKELSSFSRNNEFYFLKNVYLKFGKKSFETDFLVISKHGIFSLEVKNIGQNGNLTIKVTPDGQWLKVWGNGDVEAMQDISSQVNYHTSMTDGLLQKYKEETGKEVDSVKPVIIFANNNVMLDNQANLPIYRISQFIHEMKSQPVIMNENEMKEIYEWLKRFIAPSKSYEVFDYNEKIKEAYDILNQLSKQRMLQTEYLNEVHSILEKDKYTRH